MTKDSYLTWRNKSNDRDAIIKYLRKMVQTMPKSTEDGNDDFTVAFMDVVEEYSVPSYFKIGAGLFYNSSNIAYVNDLYASRLVDLLELVPVGIRTDVGIYEFASSFLLGFNRSFAIIHLGAMDLVRSWSVRLTARETELINDACEITTVGLRRACRLLTGLDINNVSEKEAAEAKKILTQTTVGGVGVVMSFFNNHTFKSLFENISCFLDDLIFLLLSHVINSYDVRQFMQLDEYCGDFDVVAIDAGMRAAEQLFVDVKKLQLIKANNLNLVPPQYMYGGNPAGIDNVLCGIVVDAIHSAVVAQH